MKFKKIVLLFSAALPVCIVMRLLQLIHIVEIKTGFFKQEFENEGLYMMTIIFAFAIAVAIFSFTAHRAPDAPPKPNIFMSIASVLISLSILFELFTEKFPTVVKGWQIALLNVTGITAAVFFFAFSMKLFFSFKLPKICFIIPTAYFVLRVICDFTAISSLALISDNLLLVFSYSAALLFMLNFAKLYNGIDSEYNFRKLMASGLTAVILCFTQSVPHIIVNVMNGFVYFHTSMAANINVLCTGLFIATFVFSHFSKTNSCK